MNALLSQNVHPLRSDRSVPVGTAQAGIHRDLTHPAAEMSPAIRRVAVPGSAVAPKNRPGFPFGTLQAPVRRIVGILRRIRHVGEEGKARQSLDFRHTPHVASFRFVFFLHRMTHYESDTLQLLALNTPSPTFPYFLFFVRNNKV